jgi:hypothetical protein
LKETTLKVYELNYFESIKMELHEIIWNLCAATLKVAVWRPIKVVFLNFLKAATFKVIVWRPIKVVFLNFLKAATLKVAVWRPIKVVKLIQIKYISININK